MFKVLVEVENIRLIYISHLHICSTNALFASSDGYADREYENELVK